MGFEKGHTKIGGRPKGAPNRASSQLRQSINDFLADNFDKVQNSFDKATERDKLTFYVQLLRFSVPQLQAIEMSSPIETLPADQLQYLLSELKEEMRANLKSNGRETK